ncbi:MAG: hypothetical protein NTV30_05265, partial [Chloroflexi bacterium]|nr:hypothetical protein [Chloroflexota bacterium]
GTGSDMKYAIRLTLRKTNQIIFLSYCDEEIWKRDPLTGEFDRMDYLELNQEEMQWADHFLCNLADIIKEKMVTNVL